VTGGSGFLGQAVIAYGLKQGHEMWTFDRQDGNDILGSLDDLRGADAVIHLAGVLGTHELFDAVEDAIDTNITGSYRIMKWCQEHDATYVGILMPDVFPSIYTATKVATHRIATALQHSEGLRMAHVRAFNAYGPGQKHGPGHPQKILPTFATKAWKREKLPVFGSGGQTVDLVHSEDVARMLVDAVHHASEFESRIFDAGTGVPMTVGYLATQVIRMTAWDEGERGIQYLEMRKGEEETHIVALGEGWDLLGWRPRFDMQLINEAVQWYKQ
jgi:UDP-glucose 4-epimerase